jgi:hypothetical protein
MNNKRKTRKNELSNYYKDPRMEKEYQKMVFIMNALNDGWSVKKNQDTYIFKKKHENKVEIFQEDYLATFIVNNMCLNNPVVKK